MHSCLLPDDLIVEAWAECARQFRQWLTDAVCEEMKSLLALDASAEVPANSAVQTESTIVARVCLRARLQKDQETAFVAKHGEWILAAAAPLESAVRGKHAPPMRRETKRASKGGAESLGSSVTNPPGMKRSLKEATALYQRYLLR